MERVDIFQSTLPVWEATANMLGITIEMLFQSTLPVWEATVISGQNADLGTFQSTLPVWEATAEILNKSPAKRDKEQE